MLEVLIVLLLITNIMNITNKTTIIIMNKTHNHDILFIVYIINNTSYLLKQIFV